MFNLSRKTNLSWRPSLAPPAGKDAVLDQFRARFQPPVRSCVKRGFLVEECFGAIWGETLEEIALGEEEQACQYAELIDRAKASESLYQTEVSGGTHAAAAVGFVLMSIAVVKGRGTHRAVGLDSGTLMIEQRLPLPVNGKPMKFLALANQGLD